MLIATIFLLIFAVISGVFLGVYIFFGKTYPPIALAIAHGASALTALALAIAGSMGASAAPLLKVALAALVVAALGGAFLFSCQLRGKPHPWPALVAHALLAFGGFVGFTLAALTSLAR